ncbi:hypothetical protein Mal4_01770 [Maioricimonas rarisocia]|uniref:Uncharacterized protein n=1 Tax=Maioricimonas rarisocia TaxID=2528026 RepID=A0A517Z0B4_9PLAN|nr:hypothetical protein [Maioricimonas rarisocia]QDU35895.1 hypothetical protein Mal4_01770 [Maioricimonas rarisocia]
MLKNQFGWAHLGTFLLIWLGFTIWTYLIVSAEFDGSPWTDRRVVLTTVATLLGPMTGAVSRDGQSCCLEFSLRLLPWAGAFLLAGILPQLVRWPFQRGAATLRILVWCLGLTGWFAGGIVSFTHALL